MPQPTPECKEHCKTCKHNNPENSHNGIIPFCEYMGEDIDDPENETCFDWSLKDEN